MAGGAYLSRPAPSGLADVVQTVLDRGIVIDAEVHVALLGIELIGIDARVVVASVDTYLRLAEATNRLDLAESGGTSPLDLIEEGFGNAVEHVASTVVEKKVEHVMETAVETVENVVDKVVDTAESFVPGLTRDDDDKS